MFSTKSDQLVPSKLSIPKQQIRIQKNQGQEQQQWLSSRKRKSNSNNSHPFTTQQLFCLKSPQEIEIFEDSLSIQDQRKRTKEQNDFFKISFQTIYEQKNQKDSQKGLQENLDQTIKSEEQIKKKQATRGKIQSSFLKRLKNTFYKYIGTSFNSNNFLKQLIGGKYDQIDQSSFSCDDTINNSSFNSFAEGNERRILIAQKKRQKEKTIFELQNYQEKEQTQNNYVP